MEESNMYWVEERSPKGLLSLNRFLREMDQEFRSDVATSSSFPKLNVWKNNDAALVTAEVPGIEPNQIELNVQADKLLISGELKGRKRGEGDAYHRSERSSGKFHRELTLPFRINPEKVSASYKNGILRITLGQAEENKPKKITVNAL
jgi:HSP20 family protein